MQDGLLHTVLHGPSRGLPGSWGTLRYYYRSAANHKPHLALTRWLTWEYTEHVMGRTAHDSKYCPGTRLTMSEAGDLHFHIALMACQVPRVYLGLFHNPHLWWGRPLRLAVNHTTSVLG